MNLKQFNVKELSVKEAKEIEGGFWLHILVFAVAAAIGYLIGSQDTK